VRKFSSYRGKFVCQKCKKEVLEARLYQETLDLTWMCEDKHLSKVNFNVKGY
jgi:uncharacterized protein YjaG (DUF416 family)